MEQISVFDMFKVGIGPSSSHTLGPWRAAERFLIHLRETKVMPSVCHLQVDLFGSLALTGHGHGTDRAILLGLSGADPTQVLQNEMEQLLSDQKKTGKIVLPDHGPIEFDSQTDLVFHDDEVLPFHSNGMRFRCYNESKILIDQQEYYSIGGGFVIQKGDVVNKEAGRSFPFPIDDGAQLKKYCLENDLTIPEIVQRNEQSLRSAEEIYSFLLSIWDVMTQSVYSGCHTPGVLPGGLNLRRRAPSMHDKLIRGKSYSSVGDWIQSIRQSQYEFPEILDWISCFALAVNEVNADYGRIVTAPTNGSAGVIPAVLMYAWCFDNKSMTSKQVIDFLLVASEIGSIFKKGSTISAAAGGCQAEIGVSSAMAAAGLTFVRGGSTGQCLMAAEIAMEHHLGLTCDPVRGLVQIPCIERNSLGAIKAIAATGLAINGDPSKARVSLDEIIKTMWETAQDMDTKYKETSQGGLATTVWLPEC